MESSQTLALLALGRSLHDAHYRFMTVTPASHSRVNARPANAVAQDLRGVFGWSRPFGAAVLPPDMVELMREGGVLVDDGSALRSAVRASSLGELLLFHSAWPTEGDDAVFFGPDTCRFVGAMNRALAWLGAGPARALDLGCGNGAAAITIARTFPHADVIGADLNPRALALAEVNARLAGAHNLTLLTSDLFAGIDGEFDLIVSNPPFVRDPDARTYRDGGGEQGSELSRRIVEESLQRLRPGGNLMLYTGVALQGERDHFLDSIRATLERECSAWTYEELDPDIFGEQLDEPGYEAIDRIAAVWLQATKR